MRARRPLLARWLPPLALGALALTHCSQTPTSVPLRSLERSGKMALLCLDLGATDKVGYSLEDCQARRLITRPDGTQSVVQLYAMVNQTTRGEVVLLDVPNTSVVDTNEVSPGYNFLQVGAQPVDVVATPEGTATFVASAEAGRPGLYALPSSRLLERPSLLSWPACALPARPGAMTMLVAPTPGLCPGPNYAVDTLKDQGDPTHPGGDLSREQQQPGARKLLVALPTEGELLLIDAQSLLDRPAGSFDTCPIERRFKLDSAAPDTVELTGDPPPGDECPARPPSSQADFCPVRKPRTVDYPSDYRSSPAGFAQADGTLYIADQKAPLIHAFDATDPCALAPLPPLLPSSFDQPWRPVTTRALAASPYTSDTRRFLYAVDDLDGSAMIFDITPGSGGRTPVVRSRPEYTPFSPRDRLNLGAPIQDITFVQQDLYPYDDGTGTRISGVLCDPLADPPAPAPARPGARYRTASDFSDGAQPGRLRGVFGLAALTSGQLVVIDVDDYDAACRRTRSDSTLPDWVTGCDDVCTDRDAQGACSQCSSSTPAAVNGSGEASCRVVVRHEIRNGNYVVNNSSLGRHEPGYTFPSLSLNGASLRTDRDDSGDEAKQNPKLLGPRNTSSSDGKWVVTDGSTQLGIGDPNAATADRNFLIPDVHDPHTAISQDWSATYEGVLPGTAGKVGRLQFRATDPAQRGILDPNGSFCYLGIHDVDLARREGLRFYSREQAQALDTFAQSHNDWLELTSDLLAEEDPYWASVGDQCSYLRCRANFGTSTAPTASRSFPIREAYNDRLLLGTEASGALTVADITRDGAPLDPECCFPTLTSYQIRGGNTWIAAGSASGFLHHTTLGSDGRCALLGVDASSGEVCDPTFQTRTGRAYEVPIGPGATRETLPREFTDPFTFHNPYAYFLIYAGSQPSRRGMTFSWQTNGGFEPLEISLGRGSTQVAPQSLIHHPALGTEVLVTDGALQGVLSVDLFSLSIVRTFL